MSARLLQYPKKPNEVADDLESIIYVISEGLLRFYPHTLSAPEALSLEPSTDPAQPDHTPPPVNDQLASYVANTFYQASVVSDRYVVGGLSKRDQIDAGRPSFRLLREDSDVQEEIEVFLLDLYAILCEHYDAIPDAELAQYAVPAVSRTPKIGRSRGTGVRQVPAEVRSHLVTPPATSTTAARKSRSRTDAPKRLLNSHARMLATFQDYLMDSATGAAKGHLAYNKTVDQFEGLPRNVNVESVGPSSSSVVNSASGTWAVQMDIPTLDTNAELDASTQDAFAAEEDIISKLSHLNIED
jgi:hypothetical protein